MPNYIFTFKDDPEPFELHAIDYEDALDMLNKEAKSKIMSVKEINNENSGKS